MEEPLVKPNRGCIVLAFVTIRKGGRILSPEPQVWESWIFNVELLAETPGIFHLLYNTACTCLWTVQSV